MAEAATVLERVTRRDADAPRIFHLVKGSRRYEFRPNGSKVVVRHVNGMVCRDNREMPAEEARAIYRVLVSLENYRPW